MTRDEIVAQIQVLMGFRTDMTNAIAAQIPLQQRQLERNVKWALPPWFLETERADTTLAINDERLLYPTDWIADIEDDGLWILYTDDDGVEREKLLGKTEYDTLRRAYGNCEPGRPKAYAQDGKYYRLLPQPDIAYQVKIRYFAADTIVTVGTDTNQWMTHYPDALIGRVGMFLSGAGQNQARDMFSALFLEAKSAIDQKSFDIQTTNRRYAMGENM